MNQLCVTGGVTSGKLFLLAEPCSPHLQEEGKKCPLPEVTVRMKLLICVEQCLAHVSGCCHHHHHRRHRHCHFSFSGMCQATCARQGMCQARARKTAQMGRHCSCVRKLTSQWGRLTFTKSRNDSATGVQLCSWLWGAFGVWKPDLI